MSSDVGVSVAARRSRQNRRVLIGSGMGNALEWYDWNVYAVFSSVFSVQFFASSSGVTALLQTLAVFAVGFFFRPLGGLILARVADRHGRRAGLVVTILLMAAGSLAIGIAPGYRQIGIGAPLILLLARIAQGLSTGGEFAANSSYLAEAAPPGRRGLYSSVSYISDTFGTIAAVAVSLILRALLSEHEIAQWGWRIPFLLGAVLGIVAYFIRRSLVETAAFTSVVTNQRRISRFEALRRYPIASLQVFGMTTGITVWFYTFAVYLPSYAKSVNPAAANRLDMVALISQALFCVVLPIFGLGSDRYGRRSFMLIFCGLAAVGGVPLFSLLSGSAVSLFVVQTVGLMVFAFYGAIAPTLMAEMFPTEVRAVGIGFPYALCVALFGGTAPYILQWLAAAKHAELYPWYMSALCVVSLLTSVSLIDRRKADLRALEGAR